MGSQPHPLPCTYQASTRPRRLEAADGLTLLEPGALFPQKLLGWGAVSLGLLANLPPGGEKNKAYPEPTIEGKTPELIT